MSQIKRGDTVKCVRGDIDRNRHCGEIGVVSGFAQFSSYHPREASVKFADGSAAWFWLSDLATQDAEAAQ